MCYGKIVRNSHSRVEEFLLWSRNHDMPAAPAQYKPGSGSQPFCWRETNPDLWFCERAALKIYCKSVYMFFLLQNEVCCTKN